MSYLLSSNVIGKQKIFKSWSKVFLSRLFHTIRSIETKILEMLLIPWGGNCYLYLLIKYTSFSKWFNTRNPDNNFIRCISLVFTNYYWYRNYLISIVDRYTMKSRDSFPPSDYFHHRTGRPKSRSNFSRERGDVARDIARKRQLVPQAGYIRRCEGGRFMGKNAIPCAIHKAIETSEKLFR